MDTYGITPGAEGAAKLEIIYPGDTLVVFGGELTPRQVKEEPKVTFVGDPDKYYVLSMIDPDAPCRRFPIAGEVNHWLVVNIKGGDISTGEVITEYAGSGPPRTTGLHRYIFLIFEQKEKQIFDVPKTSKDSIKHRLRFSVRKFAQKYNLGHACGGNFFQAKWEPKVDRTSK